MKTKIQKFRKEILSLKGGIFAVLMLCTLQTFAQDAFYVYRNDGDFDGFFFDQVERMGYSKTDLEGVEQDVYVIQEIQTTDSLYRIPLANIDSIGFQQPEIRFNPRLKVLDNTVLGEHFISSGINGFDEHCIWFDIDLPVDQVPQVGDVLVGYADRFTENPEAPCAGRVKEIRKLTTEYAAVLDELQGFDDIFEQFITVEQLGVDEDGNVRRRMAGLKPDGTPRRANGNFDLSLVDFSGRWTLREDDAYKGSSYTVGVDVGIQVKVSVIWKINTFWDKRAYFKIMATTKASAGASADIKWEGKGGPWKIRPKVFEPIKFPATCPLLELNPIPGIFLRTNGSIGANLTLPKLEFGQTWMLAYDSESEWGLTFKIGNSDDTNSKWSLGEADVSWIGAGLVLNGFVQVGVHQPFELATNSWISKLFRVASSIDLWLGPKIEGNLNFSVDGLASKGAYGMLKDSNIEVSFALDTEANGSCKWLNNAAKERTFWSDTKKIASSVWQFFPEFLSTKVEQLDKMHQLTATVYPRRQVLLSNRIGVALLDKNGNRAAEAWKSGDSYSLRNNFAEWTAEINTENILPGEYRVIPLTHALGYDFEVNGADTTVTVNPYLIIPQREYTVDANKNTVTIPYRTNASSVKVSQVTEEPNLEDVAVETQPDPTNPQATQKIFKVKLPANKSPFGRIIKYAVLATEGIYQSRDTISIYQPGGGEFSAFGFLGSAYMHTTGTMKNKNLEEETITDTDKMDYYVCRTIHDDYHLDFQVSDFSQSRSGNKVTIQYSSHIDKEPTSDWEGSSTFVDYEEREITVEIDVTEYPGKILSASSTFKAEADKKRVVNEELLHDVYTYEYSNDEQVKIVCDPEAFVLSNESRSRTQGETSAYSLMKASTILNGSASGSRREYKRIYRTTWDKAKEEGETINKWNATYLPENSEGTAAWIYLYFDR